MPCLILFMNNAPASDSSLTQRDLWVVRAYYFFMVGGMGFVSPFLNLFFTRQNLNGFQIGLIVAIGSIVGLVACLLYTSDAADDLLCVDLGGRRIIKKKKKKKKTRIKK